LGLATMREFDITSRTTGVVAVVNKAAQFLKVFLQRCLG
jgi:hypothetical protein